MENAREFAVRHPALTGLLFAVIAGYTAYHTFQAGMSFAALRNAVADRAREASEALGG